MQPQDQTDDTCKAPPRAAHGAPPPAAPPAAGTPAVSPPVPPANGGDAGTGPGAVTDKVTDTVTGAGPDARPAEPAQADASLAVQRRSELGVILQARRRTLTPADLGLPQDDGRLLKGLRREEIAALSGVGLTWYTWLEQGRDTNVTPAALGAVARVLQFDTAERLHLGWLAGLPDPGPAQPRPHLDDELGWLLDGCCWPAAAIGPCFDLLADNLPMRALYGTDRGVGPFHENQIWQILANPWRRELLVDYPTELRHAIELFRVTSADHLAEPHVSRLIATCWREFPAFREIWASAPAFPPIPRRIALNHPVCGRLHLQMMRLQMPRARDGVLTFLVPSDTLAVEALARLV